MPRIPQPTVESPLACAHCGLPMRVRRVEPGRRYYCCSGCALLARLPAPGSDQFPVTPALVAGLGAGFVAFNQLLFWLGSFLLRREGEREALAANLGLASILFGGALALLLVFTQWRSGASRLRDLFALIAGGALLGLALALRSPGAAALASLLLLAWSGRGFLRRKRPLSAARPGP